MTRWPCRPRAWHRSPVTSPRPPTLANGASSKLAIAMLSASLILDSLEVDLPQVFGGLLGRSRVDMEPGAPFEASGLGELGHDLEMPVVVLEPLLIAGARMQDEVVRRMIERPAHPGQGRSQDLGQLAQ